MAKIYESVTELIGGTPILNAKNFAKQAGITPNLVVGDFDSEPDVLFPN